MKVSPTGITLLKPTLFASENWKASCVVTGQLVADIYSHTELKTGDHAMLLWQGRSDIW